MDRSKHLESLASTLCAVDEEVKDISDRRVKVEHCINIKKLSDYTVSCSYGDMVFIICILKDYLKITAEKEGSIWEYYRERFAKLADKLARQINYDYEKQLEKCRKKMNAKESKSDIGGDAMALAVNKGRS